jgi:hypothetical protein
MCLISEQSACRSSALVALRASFTRWRGAALSPHFSGHAEEGNEAIFPVSRFALERRLSVSPALPAQSASQAAMKSNVFGFCALLVALIAPAATCSAASSGIGGVTGTSSPQVVTPQLTGPAPTPSYLAPPILPPTPNYGVWPKGTLAPRSTAPVKPHW